MISVVLSVATLGAVWVSITETVIKESPLLFLPKIW